MNQPRFYRNWVKSDLVNFAVSEEQTDIFVSAEKNLKKKAEELIHHYRKDISNYIKLNPKFKTSLEPMPQDENAPEIVKSMLWAGHLAGVGPMAAVAGAISEFVGKGLLEYTNEVILENGGDIFIKTGKERKIGIYAGNSVLSGKVAIRVKPGQTPLGISTSSGTVGHSLSFGKADAVTVTSPDASLADACATAACNRVKTEADLKAALDFAKSIEGIKGCVVIYKDRIGSIGEIELIRGGAQ